MLDDQTMRAHPLNSPGPFYVEDGCCTACMAAPDQAPGLIQFDEGSGHCFMARQPNTEIEVYRMIRAAHVAELSCIRYRGKDPDILTRLADLGLAEVCDDSAVVKAARFRNQVTFRWTGSSSALTDQLTEAHRRERSHTRISAGGTDNNVALELHWGIEQANGRATISVVRLGSDEWRGEVGAVPIAATPSVAIGLDDALQAVGASDVAWSSASDLELTPARWPV